jgi:hypothetical protein
MGEKERNPNGRPPYLVNRKKEEGKRKERGNGPDGDQRADREDSILGSDPPPE